MAAAQDLSYDCDQRKCFHAPLVSNKGNEFIRDVFELGPPMLVDSATMKAMKISRFERVRRRLLHIFLFYFLFSCCNK